MEIGAIGNGLFYDLTLRLYSGARQVLGEKESEEGCRPFDCKVGDGGLGLAFAFQGELVGMAISISADGAAPITT